MSVRENIMVYVANVLQQVPNATVYRSREEAIARAEGTGILIRPIEEAAENRAGMGPKGLTKRDLTIGITIIARAQPGGDVADTVADSVMQAAHGFLMADTTLGGLCATVIEHSTTWDFEVADGTALAAQVRYIVRYLTTAADISASL